MTDFDTWIDNGDWKIPLRDTMEQFHFVDWSQFDLMKFIRNEGAIMEDNPERPEDVPPADEPTPSPKSTSDFSAFTFDSYVFPSKLIYKLTGKDVLTEVLAEEGNTKVRLENLRDEIKWFLTINDGIRKMTDLINIQLGTGVWVAFSWDMHAIPAFMHFDELTVRRWCDEEMGEYGLVTFWEYGRTWEDTVRVKRGN